MSSTVSLSVSLGSFKSLAEIRLEQENTVNED